MIHLVVQNFRFHGPSVRPLACSQRLGSVDGQGIQRFSPAYQTEAPRGELWGIPSRQRRRCLDRNQFDMELIYKG